MAQHAPGQELKRDAHPWLRSTVKGRTFFHKSVRPAELIAIEEALAVIESSSDDTNTEALDKLLTAITDYVRSSIKGPRYFDAASRLGVQVCLEKLKIAAPQLKDDEDDEKAEDKKIVQLD